MYNCTYIIWFLITSGNHRVAVFQSLTGDPITILQPVGAEIKDRFSPYGITVDNKGHIYVCDQFSQKLYVFSDITVKLNFS